MKNQLLIVLLLISLPCYAQDAANPPTDTAHVQATGTTLSPEAAEAYIDSLIQNEDRKFIDPHNITTLGLSNLIAIYKKTGPDQLKTGDTPWLKEGEPASQKRIAVEKAIGLVATPNDIGTLLDLYAAQPLILDVFAAHPDWDTNPQVAAFLASNVDTITTAYQTSDLATKSLLILLNRSNDSNVQFKFSTFLSNTAQGTVNGHLAADLVTAYLGTPNPNPELAKDTASIFSTLAGQISTNEDEAKLSWRAIYDPLVMDDLRTNAQVFLRLVSEPTMRAALLKVAKIAKSENKPYGENASNLIAAIGGDHDALRSVVQWCQTAPNTVIPFGFFYLKTVHGAKPDDILKSIAANLDSAVYDPSISTWSIPNTDGPSQLNPATTGAASDTPKAATN